MKTSFNNDELINSGGGWAPGKLDHDKIPFLVWPPKPLKFLKWLFHPTDGYICLLYTSPSPRDTA